MRMIEILALFRALKNTAKKYHWKTVGQSFMSDHLLFDRIYNDLDDGLIDTIVEEYYMGLVRKNIDDVDNLTPLSLQYEGTSYPAVAENIPLMFQELANMMSKFITNIEKIKSLRGVNAELDNMASIVNQLYGLVLARLS